MQVAGVDVYMSHPVLALGSTDWLPILSLEQQPAVACDTHVAVRVQAQVRLIRVRIFIQPFDQGVVPDETFTDVFDGPLALPGGRLVVGDVMGESRFVKLLGNPGRRRIRVAVDQPGRGAGAIDICIGDVLD
ncbi:hypothetical protein OV450_2987 [Actinobacteria bacterium OV450]|nr:hypothetical protein OV450_2987 [Actinobacteria bacterium OV450]